MSLLLLFPAAGGAGTQDVTANLIASTGAVGQPTVTSLATIAPNLIASTVTVSQPTITVGAVTVSPNLIASTGAVGQPTVFMGTGQTVEATLIASTLQISMFSITIISNKRIARVAAEERTIVVDS